MAFKWGQKLFVSHREKFLEINFELTLVANVWSSINVIVVDVTFLKRAA